MSKSNGPPSTSDKNSAAPRYQSLVDILKQPQLGMRTRGADNKLHQFCLPNLDGSQGASVARLNLSRASIRSEENLIDASTIVERSRVAAEKNASIQQETTQLNILPHIGKNSFGNLRAKQAGSRGHGKVREHFSGGTGDTKTDIERFLKAIDKSESNFEDNDKNGILSTHVSEFNFIQLPKNFTLEHGRVNCYRSGIIEVISGDNPPQTYRFKPTTTTDLIISTDKKIHIDQMKVYSPESMTTGKKS